MTLNAVFARKPVLSQDEGQQSPAKSREILNHPEGLKIENIKLKIVIPVYRLKSFKGQKVEGSNKQKEDEIGQNQCGSITF